MFLISEGPIDLQVQNPHQQAGQRKILMGATRIIKQSVAVRFGVSQSHNTFEKKHESLLFVTLSIRGEGIERNCGRSTVAAKCMIHERVAVKV
jgi:hypothetical protein